MRALVTGGAGFIGSNLVDRLVADGHDVGVVDNFSSGQWANLNSALANGRTRLEVITSDIRDPRVVGDIEEFRPEVVFHLAAQIDVRVSVQDPALDAAINVVGGLNVLEGARRSGARKVVFASSGGTIYGDVSPEQLPVDETHPLKPVSPYGISKRVFTDYLQAYATLHGLEYTSLALANVFGPRQDPHGEAGVVAIFASRLLAGEECKIFGDGKATRDYVFVTDVVDAFARAADSGTGLYNIGTGVETSAAELYAVMAEAAGVTLSPTFAPARPGELQRSALNAEKAHSELGWAPRVALPDGAAQVLKHLTDA